MLTPERNGELEFVTVKTDHLDEAISSIKARLPDEDRVCDTCKYQGKTHRWGIKTYGTTDPNRLALVLCCPACENHINIPIEIKD